MNDSQILVMGILVTVLFASAIISTLLWIRTAALNENQKERSNPNIRIEPSIHLVEQGPLVPQVIAYATVHSTKKNSKELSS